MRTSRVWVALRNGSQQAQTISTSLVFNGHEEELNPIRGTVNPRDDMLHGQHTSVVDAKQCTLRFGQHFDAWPYQRQIVAKSQHYSMKSKWVRVPDARTLQALRPESTIPVLYHLFALIRRIFFFWHRKLDLRHIDRQRCAHLNALHDSNYC